MPAPLLPNEVLLDIVSHVAPEPRKAQDSIKEGKTMSLVCRSWKDVGQALRWSTIKLPTSEVALLIGHFSRYPRLAKLVRTLLINFHANEKRQDMRSQAFASLPQLISLCTKTKEVVAVGEMGRYLPTILKLLSVNPDLETLKLIYAGHVDWTDEVASVFQNGFRNLSSLVFDGFVLTFMVSGTGRSPQQTSRIPLKCLSMFWQNQPYELEDQLASRLLVHFDQNTLLTVDLRESAITDDAFQWLSSCFSLTKIVLTLTQDQAYNLDSYLSLLPRFRSLETFIYEVHLDEDFFDAGLGAPVKLSKVLDSFPSSLRLFEAKRLVFADFDSIPLRELSPDQKLTVPRLLATSATDDGGGQELEVWADGTGGNIKWYRNVQLEP